MSLGFPNSNGGRTTDSALFHALGNAFVGSWISGFRVRQADPAGMSVFIGGESGTPDDLLLRDSMFATFPVSNLNSQPVQAAVVTANGANPRLDSVVIYIDSSVKANHDSANNENRTKAIVVPGTPATSPSPPSVSQIRAAIGASSPYEIIAEILVRPGAVSILDRNITDRRDPATLADGRINNSDMFKNGVIGSDALSDGAILPRHLSATLRDYSTSSTDTGTRWINGKTIFRQTFEADTRAQGNVEQVVDIGLPRKPLQIIKIEGGIRAGTDFYPLEYINPNAPSGQNSQLKLTFYNGVWQLRFNTGASGKCTVTVYYTE